MALVTGDVLKRNSILQAAPAAATPDNVNTLAITDAAYKTTVIDTKWTPRTSLLTHIEGASWTVDYYSQVITSDSGLSGQQYTRSSVHQSYKLVKSMELKVTTALNSSQDSQTGAMTVTGSSMLYPFLVPNAGDMFIADIGEGKTAVFRVTESVKKSIFKEACYEISYGLDTDATDKILDLADKVVETFYYHKDFLIYGQNPLLLKSDTDLINDLDKAYSVVAKHYFKKYFSNEFKTIMVPAQVSTTYDHFLVDFLMSEFNVHEVPELVYLRKLNVQDDDAMKSDSFWKAIKYRDISFMNTCFKRAGMVGTNTFTNDAVLEGIRYTGISKAVYPVDPLLTVDYMFYNQTKIVDIEGLSPSPVTSGMNNAMVKAINLRDIAGTVGDIVYPVTVDDHYVLSQHFYNKDTSLSTLEVLVWNYIEQKEVDKEVLLNTSKMYHTWGVLEQFYYLPIILVLIRAAIRGI